MPQFPRGGLPPLQFVTTDAAQIEAQIVADCESFLGRTLAPADPYRLFLMVLAARQVQSNNYIDYAAKQNFLSYAEGNSVDHIADRDNIPRLDAIGARSTARFTLASARPSVYTIDAGTLITDASGTVVFATTQAAQIAIGMLSVDVPIICTVAGIIGNGFLPGQINVMVNPLPFMQGVSNISTTAGGTDREDDEAYVARIRLAKTGFSIAGPSDAYKYWAFTAHPGIANVEVSTPAPCQVDVRVLMEGGALPTPEVIADVQAALRSKDRRPMTDFVTVAAPTLSSYEIEFSYWIDTLDTARVATIQAAVNAAVADYIAWQGGRIGRDINPDQLIWRVMQAGAKRLTVTSPVFTVVGAAGVAALDGTPTVTYEGTEDG